VFGGIVPLLIMLVVIGHVAPHKAMLAAPHNAIAGGIAAVLALAGLLIFEWCFVMAGQSVPNS